MRLQNLLIEQIVLDPMVATAQIRLINNLPGVIKNLMLPSVGLDVQNDSFFKFCWCS